ncbi:MAG: TonB-dependent hemoglobin/transferrin/lactoferrin family receptor [Rhodoplanes sp.]|uniref:TonB-dependent hemoglobin/transferrin/lactoferrin family receptor n=1 Tax=Rhodoplanes sp. TaxID=1968906 RepID=UPI0017D5FF48|nr:TonB-dependent hemoglobin/transferrin/lactoferrin family receptor [Rhodoplanes sp.]NVO15375.1 TonB-dependent hemoglobin/transferrin/lactoferrin family receptor [Rhodoplanes sp.]
MAGRMRGADSLLFGVSAVALLTVAGTSVQAQSAETLDAITVVATKTEEKAIDALAPVSTVRMDQIDQILPKRLSDMLIAVPGVSVQDRGDEPSTAINIRGLQDFGRVAVVVDGARQNYQRTGHFANGAFYLDPELVGGVDIVRGPTANIYGSGAIGGVVSFRTKDIQDVVRPGETWGVEGHTQAGTNHASGLGSVFGGVHVNPNVDFFAGGSFKSQSNYNDGNGNEVLNSWNKVGSAVTKLTVRPAEGHEVKLSGTFQDFRYDFGQPARSGLSGVSIYATDVTNYTTSARWRYARPEDRLIDWDANVYWNRTESDQTKIAHTSTSANAALCGAGVSGNAISGCVGDQRSYQLDTVGFDANNTARFDAFGLRHAVTIGGDAFNDKVATFDPHGNSNVTTPSGERTVGGAFAQIKSNYSTWLEVIGAARYDAYRLEGLGTTTSGDRVSPKITVGVTPLQGFTPYVTYAEGYRAPSLTEAIIDGSHARASSFEPGFLCPDGNVGLFCFLPNPNLRAEVGKNKEAGLNLKYDNVLLPGATFRGKVNVFRNDVDDYIELVGFGGTAASVQYYQYQNLPHARIEGVEVETMYDAGGWFVGVAGQHQRGWNVDTGVGLLNVQPDKIVTTLGARFLDRKITATIRWSAYASNTNIPANYIPADAYNLVNVYVGYQPTPDVLMGFSVDNILNEFYRPYPIPRTASGGDPITQNDTLWASPAPGITFKGSMKIRFGGA